MKRNKGEFPFYNLSIVAVIDGTSQDTLWSINCTKGEMTSGITITSNKQGQDGVLFLGVGCHNHDSSGKEIVSRDVCPRRYIDVERAVCQKKDKRDASMRQQKEMAGGDDDSIIENVQRIEDYPKYDNIQANDDDLWVIQDDSDWFPNPWNETRSFIEDYCQQSYDQLTVQLYFVTSSLAKSYTIEPLFQMTPYVYSESRNI